MGNVLKLVQNIYSGSLKVSPLLENSSIPFGPYSSLLDAVAILTTGNCWDPMHLENDVLFMDLQDNENLTVLYFFGLSIDKLCSLIKCFFYCD